MQQIAESQAFPEVPINENFAALAHQAVYAMRAPATTGLVWGYWGGRWGGFSVADGALTLADAATNHMVVERATGAISASTSATNWDDGAAYARVFKITTASGLVSAVEDHRAGPGGVHGGGGAAASAVAPLVTVAGSSRDMAPADASRYLRFTATGAKTATFDDGDGFAEAQEFHLANRGASGDLTLTEAGGMTLNAPAGGSLVVPPGGTVTVKIVAEDEADVFGLTVEA